MWKKMFPRISKIHGEGAMILSAWSLPTHPSYLLSLSLESLKNISFVRLKNCMQNEKGTFKNYVRQYFWTLTCCKLLMWSHTCAYQGVTVCYCWKVLRYVIIQWTQYDENEEYDEKELQTKDHICCRCYRPFLRFQ